MTGEEMLQDPLLWGAFLRHLSEDTSIEHHREAIREFAEVIGLPPCAVINKMRAFFHPGNEAIN
jgi:hypothetical protein